MVTNRYHSDRAVLAILDVCSEVVILWLPNHSNQQHQVANTSGVSVLVVLYCGCQVGIDKLIGPYGIEAKPRPENLDGRAEKSSFEFLRNSNKITKYIIPRRIADL